MGKGAYMSCYQWSWGELNVELDWSVAWLHRFSLFFFLPRQMNLWLTFFFLSSSLFFFYFISLLLLRITNKISIQRPQIPMICHNHRQCSQNSQYHHLRHLPPSYQPFQLILLQNPQPRNWPYHWSLLLSQRLLWSRIWMLLHLWLPHKVPLSLYCHDYYRIITVIRNLQNHHNRKQ